jgi:hypothetical protein
MEENENKLWKKNYTWVLIANAIYILFYFIIMQLFS